MNSPKSAPNNFCESVRDLVSKYQKDSYALYGKDAKDIQEESIKHYQKYLQNNQLPDFYSLPAIESLTEGFSITDYQDITIIGEIAQHWSSVVEIAQKLFPDRFDERPDILLASVPQRFLNGQAFRDQEGQYAVVLYEGLRYLPGFIAEQTLKFFFYFDKDGDLKQHESFAEIANEVNISSKLRLGGSLLEVIHYHLTSPYILHQTESYGIEAIEHKKSLFKLGFKFFINAHEFSHCMNDHCNPASTKQRLHEDLNHAMETVKSALPDTNITEEQIEHFRTRQYSESIADCEALLMLMTFAKLGFEKSEWDFLIMGGLAFFWYVELHERIARTLKFGLSWQDEPPYKMDFSIQNLLFRKSHPAPLSRFIEAKKVSNLILSEDTPAKFYILDDDWKKASDVWKGLSKIYETIWSADHEYLNSLRKTQEIDKSWRPTLDIKTSHALSDDLDTCFYNNAEIYQ